MSYSASFASLIVEELNDLTPENLSACSPPFDALHDEPKEQLYAAINCAGVILDSGVLGPPGTRVNINISGHANPEFENNHEGYSPNHVTIGIHAQRRVEDVTGLDRRTDVAPS